MTKLWGKVTDGTIGNDIVQGLEGGLNGYRQVRDHAPLGVRIWLKTTMTVTEMGMTAGLSGIKAVSYDLVSGAFFDTAPVTKASLAGFYSRTYVDKSLGTEPVYLNDLNPYKF